MGKKVEDPSFTVVYPGFDVRGHAAEHLGFWTSAQTLPRERYRVVALLDPDSGDEDSVRELLVEGDQLIVGQFGSDIAMWNAGVSAASTAWVVLTEGHGLAQPASLAALEEWISSAPIADAGNSSIIHHDDYLMARLSRRWFGVQQDQWSNEWTRLHRATYTIRKEVFLKLGGLPPYGQFGVPLLSAKLAEEGYTVERVPGADVLHLDDDTIYDHHFDTIDFVVGECEARAASDPTFFEKYFGHREVFTNRLLAESGVARPIFSICLSAAFADAENRARFQTIAKSLIRPTFFTPDFRIAVSELITSLDEALLLFPFVPNEFRYRWFVSAHHRVVETALLKWNHERVSVEGSSLYPEKHTITDLSPDSIAGLHGLENYEGRPFRWSGPVLHLRLPDSEAIETVVLDTGRISPFPVDRVLLVLCGSDVLPQECLTHAPEGELVIRLPKVGFLAEKQNSISILIKETETSPEDTRDLGLPVFGISIF